MILKKHSKTAWRTIAGEGVILSLDTKVLRGLNPAGARVWELIDGQRSVDSIGQQIAQEFQVEPARALADIERFLQDLLARGLVEAADSP
ncbi:MAG TPA: PqqD family protein [Methylomirabilota bacterium]|nr:PqqD family protein [Methylomirabilota bacterium]